MTVIPSNGVPKPDHDPASVAYGRWADYVRGGSGRANEFALLGDCDTAASMAQAVVDADDVNRNQYLNAGREYSQVFETMSWCPVSEEQKAQWTEWGKRHLGATDGSIGDRGFAIWWSRRWSRDNPANNYYHSFVTATSVYAMATGDDEWLDYLKTDRLPLMYSYYSTTPEGGSREGTGYGESHREVFRIAKMWRDYDGTDIVPQAFIDNSIRFWVHAITPGSTSIALFGDQTRAKGRLDGYHCDIFDNALQVSKDPVAIEMGKWQIGQLRCDSSRVFLRLILRDYEPTPRPVMPLEYHAKGAGVLFVRDSWADDATFLYFTAGIRDEAHQCEDQGAFAVFKGEWKTAGAHAWDRNGLCAGKIEGQNVLLFPGVTRNIRHSESTLEWSVKGNTLTVDMDLSAAVGREWTRHIEWVRGSRLLAIEDEYEGEADFGFFSPDNRAQHENGKVTW